MNRVSILHAQTDAIWAAALQKWLRAAGLQAELVSEVPVGASELEHQIESVLAAHKVIIVSSPAFSAELLPLRLWEAGQFHTWACQERERKFLPVCIRWAPLPPLLEGIRHCNLLGASDVAAELGKLAQSLDVPAPNALELEALRPAAAPIPEEDWQTAVELVAAQMDNPLTWEHFRAQASRWNPANFPGSRLRANAWLWLQLASACTANPVESLLHILKEEALAHALRRAGEKAYANLLESLERHRPEVAQRSLLRDYLGWVLQVENKRLATFLGDWPEALVHTMYVELRAADLRGHLGECERRTLTQILEQDPHRCWVLLGEPGSGKSTLIRHQARWAAQRALDALDRGEPIPKASIPVVVELRRKKSQGQSHWLHAIRELSGRRILPADIDAALEAEAQQGRLLYLLDGMDEVRGDELADVVHAVGELATSPAVSKNGCRMVVTSRWFGYQRPLDGDFREMQLLPLDATAQIQLAANWLKVWKLPAERARDVIDAAIAARLQTEAGNPFFLTLMLVLTKEDLVGGRPLLLPHGRAKLLRQATDCLIRGWPRAADHHRGPHDLEVPTRMVLEHLALELLELGAGPYSQQDVQRIVGTILDEYRQLTGQNTISAGALLNRIFQETEILRQMQSSSRIEVEWSFPHRAIQEHLAAARLAQEPERWRTLARKIGAPGDSPAFGVGQWAETFALMAGEPNIDANQLLNELMKVNPDLAVRALAAADSLSIEAETFTRLLALEQGGDNWQKRREVILAVGEKLADAPLMAVRLLDGMRKNTRHGADLFFIREALRALSQHGDAAAAQAAQQMLKPTNFFGHCAPPPSLGDLTIELPNGKIASFWCPVAVPGNNKRVGPFEMARLPVWNALYEKFSPEHKEDRAFAVQVLSQELDWHPVVNVTWFEAQIFCEWLAQTNPGVTLPTETEWFWAATAGDPKREKGFPWGAEEPTAERAVFDADGERQRTERVGSCPKGAAPYGQLDMAGNVWEWMGNFWDDERGPRCDLSGSVDTDAEFALRGGCWDFSASSLRAANRNRSRAWYRLGNVGFRVVRVLPPA